MQILSAGTLRRWNILRDLVLTSATNIVKLDVSSNAHIMKVEPFAASLREVATCGTSGICDDAGLTSANKKNCEV